jgi:molecular chaperone GrpE
MGGIQAVDRQLRSVLEGHNVVRIPAHGELFDPEIHEAVASDPSEEHPENTVLQELEPGYKMAERVIRPARVRVSTKP